MMEKILLKNIENPNSADIREYQKTGGYQSISNAFEMQPRDVIEEVKSSGLRGRGGAGFPTAMKWNFANADPKFPKYLVCNADEGEPGTFKDRPILEKNPHLLIEGMVISGYALRAEYGYIYLRGEYPLAKDILDNAIAQAREKNYLGENILGKNVKFELSVYQGAGAYICGEETALIESLEGKKGQPRSKPPFPVNVGAWEMPTIVNNVETLSNVPYIIAIGGEAYSKIGREDCTGPKLYCVSGHVVKPGVYELPMGTNLRDIIYKHAGGIKNNKKLKAVLPGGISTPVLPADRIDCLMDFISMPKHGSMLGSGAVIVMDESVCMVKVAHRALKFFEHESCGKCVPCREGTGWLRQILGRIESGKGKQGDIELLSDITDIMSGRTFCPLGDGAAGVVTGMLRHFRDEFEEHIKSGHCKLSIDN
ncbi:MAG TPA: NADH oxidoreductase (quinone) subunit F [Nitrospirae bacterium]|nr:NADH oxidoreductase (quinone) subunit F [Nitrospirota bacterium]HDK17502.1 NADH oxidoreductase (quinone) subunit F [Nitrospirota bacterium]HDK41309.1 NADH oxidoreductase (quinone) subunit F [Nitrospirota bacterium]HDK81586.1 NADH oxidoreductase (quinone) subunit F [Nitrospirota bacterium]